VKLLAVLTNFIGLRQLDPSAELSSQTDQNLITKLTTKVFQINCADNLSLHGLEP
jgi:hypothetical protein